MHVLNWAAGNWQRRDAIFVAVCACACSVLSACMFDMSWRSDLLAWWQVEALKKFLDSGFRLILMGEHSGYAPTENAHITKAVAAMGGGVEVLTGTERLRDLTAANKQIADVAVATGVFQFGVADWAPLKVNADVTEVVMADSNGNIFMADQVLRKGRLTVWADKNLFGDGYGNKGGRNLPLFYNLVHQAAFYKKEVKAGRDPNAYANEKLKAEREGKPTPPKPVVVYTPTSAPTAKFKSKGTCAQCPGDHEFASSCVSGRRYARFVNEPINPACLCHLIIGHVKS